MSDFTNVQVLAGSNAHITQVQLGFSADVDADEVGPLLFEEADSGYIRVRCEGVNLLGRCRDPRAVPTLMGALKDKSPRVAAMAAFGHTPGQCAFVLHGLDAPALVVGDAISNAPVSFARPLLRSR